MDVYLLIDIVAAYILDLIIGDPHRLPHPVRFIGFAINVTEKFLRKLLGFFAKDNNEHKKKFELLAGFFLALFVISSTSLIVFVLLKAAKTIHPILFHAVNTYFIYSALAGKCLADEGNKICKVLKEGNINNARKDLSMLVGRQTENLDEKEIIRGTVETIAENTVDGVISPLFYTFIGSVFGIGAPLVYAFKASSTLDSMVGYMNEKYIYLGRVSAKVDDFLNYIPARISGVLIPAGAFLCGMGFTRSFKIMLRDRRNHKSPNCAYPEAAVAGALGVKLGGNNVYFGKIVEKPTIGDSCKLLEAKDIKDTIRLMYISSFLTLLLGLVVMLRFHASSL